MPKIKFEYHYPENTLFIQDPEGSRPITKTFTTAWNSPGFILEPASHWITFTTYPTKITTFYKATLNQANPNAWTPNLPWKDWKVSSENLAPLLPKITYYQKDLPKQSPLTFTFEKSDQVEKVEGVWVKKYHGK